MSKKEEHRVISGEERTPQDEQTLTGGIGNVSPDQYPVTNGQQDASQRPATPSAKKKTERTTPFKAGAAKFVDKIAWNVGDVIDGRYEVLDLIGRGGMGIVYKVYHREWKTDLAVKMPLSHLVTDEASKARFIREAQTWVDLGLHPNIVQCLYVRELGGVPRVFMEYVGGGSLKDWVKTGKVGPGTWERILDLMIQACDGLGYAHERGVEVHRDVKPGNMLLTDKGELLVTDFGIVKRAGVADIQGGKAEKSSQDAYHTTVTETGSEVGTPEYGAPEQWTAARDTDSRADIYALGVILFELCCGRRPFDDGSHSEPPHVIIGRHLSVPAPNPGMFNKEVPGSLSEIILKCLEKDPERRPKSMVALRKDLAAIYEEIVGKRYRRAIPQSADLRSNALNNRAVSLLDLGRVAEAFEAWNEALKLDPFHLESTYNYFLLQWRENKITDETVLNHLEEVRQMNTDAALYLGFVNLERGAADKAEQEFIDVLGKPEFTENGMVWRALGDARIAQARYAEAEEAYRHALTLIPKDTESLEKKNIAHAGTRLQNGRAIVPWQRCFHSFEEGHTHAVTCVAITPDKRYVISGSKDKTLRLWSLMTRDCLRTFKGHEESVQAVAVTPDGRYAVSGGHDRTLRMWELATGRCLWIGRGHKDEITTIAISPNGQFAVSGSLDKTIRLWVMATGECLWISEKQENPINVVAITPDEQFILSGHEEENLYLWDLRTGKRKERKFYGSYQEGVGGASYAVSALTISSDGNFAVTGTKSGSLQLWDMNAGSILQTFVGHDETITGVAITPDGRYIISGSKDSNLNLWDVKTGEHLWMFEGHKGVVNAAAMTSDGQWVVSGGQDTTLRVWDRESRKQLWTFWGAQGHEGEVTSLAIALNGRFVVSGSQDTTLRLWDVATARCLHTYKGHQSGLTAVAVLPDGRFAISGSRDATLILWELGTTDALRVFKDHTKGITTIAVSSDGRLVVSGSMDKTLRLWDTETAECLQVFEGHTDEITSVRFMPDHRFLISGSYDKTLRVWEVETGTCVKVLEGHTGVVTSLCVMLDGQFLLSGSSDRTLRLWDFATGNCLRIFTGHREGVTSVAATPDGEYALSGSNDETVRLWDMKTTKCLRTFKEHRGRVNAIAVTSNGRYAISGGADYSLRLWALDRRANHYEAPIQLSHQRELGDLYVTSDRFRQFMTWAKAAWEDGKAVAAYKYLMQARTISGYERASEALMLNTSLATVLPRKTLQGGWLSWMAGEHLRDVLAIAVTPNNRFVVSGSKDKTLRLWELATAKCLRVFDAYRSEVNAVAITPDGHFAVSGNADATLRLWDLGTAKCLRTYNGHDKEVFAVAVSPYGRFIVSGSKDKTLRMWNPATAEGLRVFKGHKQGVTAIAVSQDQQLIVSGSHDRTVRVWDSTTGRCLQTFIGHFYGITAVTITLDGKFVVSASRDKTLRLWEIATAKCLAIFRGHEAEVTSLVLTPGGRFVISGSLDETLKVWELATGRSIWTLKGHAQGIAAIAITSDGRFMVSGSHDKTLRVWELDWELDLNGNGVPEIVEPIKTQGIIGRLASVFKK